MQETGNKRFELVPANFFDPARSFDVLGCPATALELPQFRAWFVYASELGEAPVLFGLLGRLLELQGYNKVLCEWSDGRLSLAIAQGKQLLLANEYQAPDFTTAQYYIFLAMKSLQLNPEVTVVRFAQKLAVEQEISLCRYFKSVECE